MCQETQFVTRLVMPKVIFPTSTFLALLCLLCNPLVVHSQLVNWIPSIGPASIGGIAVAPNGDYLVSDAHLLYRSTDRGLTWKVNRATCRGSNEYTLTGPITISTNGILIDGCFTKDYGTN